MDYHMLQVCLIKNTEICLFLYQGSSQGILAYRAHMKLLKNISLRWHVIVVATCFLGRLNLILARTLCTIRKRWLSSGYMYNLKIYSRILFQVHKRYFQCVLFT
jgi:hypothetical protein